MQLTPDARQLVRGKLKAAACILLATGTSRVAQGAEPTPTNTIDVTGLVYILNPRTGWPVEDAPRSVTVVASTCVEAGTLSTLAYLQGPLAEEFLREQRVQFRIVD